MKKIISIIAAMVVFGMTASAATIPDHNGTDLSQFKFGTSKLNSAVKSYSHLFKSAGDQYGVDPNILAAVCMQESSGKNYMYYDDGTSRPAWGIMQIEYTNEKSFANFGKDTTGVAWTLEDRAVPEKAVPYAAWMLSEALYKYDYDYAKMLQSYNFGQGMLNKILAAAGDNWLAERANAVKYVSNWPYSSYGDKEYIEHVLRYYHYDIPYIGAKVTVNGSLVKFYDQFPIIEDGTTLIPVRAVGEMLNANVSWDGATQTAIITKNGKVVKVCVGTPKAYINDIEYDLGVGAKLVNNRTLVPLRFIAEALDMDVIWHGERRMVELVTRVLMAE